MTTEIVEGTASHLSLFLYRSRSFDQPGQVNGMPVVAYTLRIPLFKSDICRSIRWHVMRFWGRRPT